MGTICYGHWVLHLVISHTRQGLRFVNGIGFCVFWNHTLNRRFDLLRVLGLAFCLAYERAGVTICYEHWVLHFAISHTRQRVRFVTGIELCIWRSRTGAGVRFATGIGLCIWGDHTRAQGYVLLRRSVFCILWSRLRNSGATICYGHWVLRLVISHTRQGCDLLRALSFRLVISHTKQGVRLVTGIGFCMLWYHTRDRVYGLLRTLVSASCDITHHTGSTIYHTRDKGYDLLPALCSASWNFAHETRGTICYGH